MARLSSPGIKALKATNLLMITEFQPSVLRSHEGVTKEDKLIIIFQPDDRE